ncbi:acetaldehyde dehydrogenase (acetylating), partial [Streptomyces prasinus]
ETTSAAIVEVGGARRGKAIIILNPAEPPLMMRDTVFALVGLPEGEDGETAKRQITESVEKMVAEVSAYVPGYTMVQDVQITEIPSGQPVETLLADGEGSRPTHQVSVFLKVEGAGMYLPAYAGNLDIMTSAAVRMAERIAAAKETAK